MNRYKSELGKALIYESYDLLLQTWNVTTSELQVETSYGATHLILAGDSKNPPLLLFHGTGDNAAMMWIYNVQELAAHYYVIAVDAVGGSGKSEPNESYEKQFDQLTWIDDILQALRLNQVYIAGVSYGAYLSYYYMLNRPDKVTKAVCMAGRVPSSSLEVVTKMMKAFMPEALFPSEANCRKLLRKLSAPGSSVFEDNADLLKHWFYLLMYFNNKSMFKHKITMIPNEQLTTIRTKVLFLIGQHDILSNYPKAINKLTQLQFPYKIVEGAGHAINHEQPSLVNQEMIQFFAEGDPKLDRIRKVYAEANRT